VHIEHVFDSIVAVRHVPSYAELHCHSNFSFLDGASFPEALVERAAELGYRALAITDHNGFYGAVKFHVAASERGLPTVYGVEVSLPAGSWLHPAPGGPDPLDRIEIDYHAPGRGRTHRMHGQKPLARPPGDHLVLLAPSPAGYAALSRLVSRAQFRGEKDLPEYAWTDLVEAATAGELVALTGCRGGAVPKAAAAGDLNTALAALSSLREVFGRRLYVELWQHAMPEDDPRNDLLATAAHRLRLPMVATNNVHYRSQAESDLAEVLAAVGGRCNLDGADGFRPASDERYLKTPVEMARRFSRYPGAVETAAELGAVLAFDLKLVAPRLPDFPMPDGFRSEADFLHHLVWQGAQTIYPDGNGEVEADAASRLRHELKIIGELGFPGYFLITWDLVGFARARGIYCQIRGSGADSAVCRCLGLTRVDPIRLGLPFERFLSEERGRPPDIDIDFEAERREEVIQYCYRRYGRQRAAMVANVITYRARSVLQDVGKTFGFTQAQVNALSRYVDSHDPAHLPELVELPDGFTAERIYQICLRLDGFPRHLGIHSGGMVIADRPLYQVVPLEWGRMQDRSVLQWDKDDCAAMGIVKFDLLGLGMLNALHLAVDTVREAHGISLDLAAIPQEPAIYAMLTKADTVGLFQVESRAQMATLPRMKPKTFYDLAIEVALIRPGPIQGHSVHPFLRRRNGEEPIRYPHPTTEPILAKTLGVPVFQEQLMELARICAGFSPGQSDRLRQAMTHKRSDREMEKLRQELFAGMARQAIEGAAAEEIWEKLQGFASFGFPESHSVSFAYIVYMSAWLKYHWPTEFLGGLLNAQPMGFYSPNSLIHDARRHGVMVLGPDVNLSDFDCTVEPASADTDDVVSYYGAAWRRGRGPVDDPLRPAVSLRVGLRYVRDLGEAEITRIEAARLIGGEFTSGIDLAHRTGLSTAALEGLAGAGALESLGLGRREGIWAAGPLGMAGPERLGLVEGASPPRLPSLNPVGVMQIDLWSTGMSPRHPVEFIRERLAEVGCLSIAEALAQRKHGQRAKVGGVVTHRQRPGTARGVRFFNLEDETGILNVVVLPEIWEANWEVGRKAVGMVIEGRLEYRDGVTNLVAHGFEAWPTAAVQSRDFR